jgi:hypothetical protein
MDRPTCSGTFERGADDCVTKPFSYGELRRVGCVFPGAVACFGEEDGVGSDIVGRGRRRGWQRLLRGLGWDACYQRRMSGLR